MVDHRMPKKVLQYRLGMAKEAEADLTEVDFEWREKAVDRLMWKIIVTIEVEQVGLQ